MSITLATVIIAWIGVIGAWFYYKWRKQFWLFIITLLTIQAICLTWLFNDPKSNIPKTCLIPTTYVLNAGMEIVSIGHGRKTIKTERLAKIIENEVAKESSYSQKKRK